MKTFVMVVVAFAAAIVVRSAVSFGWQSVFDETPNPAILGASTGFVAGFVVLFFPKRRENNPPSSH